MARPHAPVTVRGLVKLARPKLAVHAVVESAQAPSSLCNMKVPTLLEVDAYDVPSFLAARIALIHKVPEDFALALLREAKRMLYLSVVSNDSIAPPDRVDWAWHEMLMFTRWYKAYAEFIGAFIHHDPNPPSGDMHEETWEEIQANLGKPTPGTDTYIKTKNNYEKYFGEKPNPLYWP